MKLKIFLMNISKKATLIFMRCVATENKFQRVFKFHGYDLSAKWRLNKYIFFA